MVVPGSAIRGEVIEGNVPRCAICMQKVGNQKKKQKPAKKKKSTGGKPWDNEESDEESMSSQVAGLMKVSAKALSGR